MYPDHMYNRSVFANMWAAIESFVNSTQGGLKSDDEEQDGGIVPVSKTNVFPVFWNIDENLKPVIDVTQFGISPKRLTQTGLGCGYGDANCSVWSMGLLPYITLPDDHIVVHGLVPANFPLHGGVPQNGYPQNLVAHLAALRSQVQKWIPDPEWNGNAVFDFERWTPVWVSCFAIARDLLICSSLFCLTYFREQSACLTTCSVVRLLQYGGLLGESYQNLSIQLVKKAHPTWNASQTLTQAMLEFETAGLAFYTQSLLTCRAMRPHARWGW